MCCLQIFSWRIRGQELYIVLAIGFYIIVDLRKQLIKFFRNLGKLFLPLHYICLSSLSYVSIPKSQGETLSNPEGRQKMFDEMLLQSPCEVLEQVIYLSNLAHLTCMLLRENVDILNK